MNHPIVQGDKRCLLADALWERVWSIYTILVANIGQKSMATVRTVSQKIIVVYSSA
jgi:hypothetical protein